MRERRQIELARSKWRKWKHRTHRKKGRRRGTVLAEHGAPLARTPVTQYRNCARAHRRRLYNETLGASDFKRQRTAQKEDGLATVARKEWAQRTATRGRVCVWASLCAEIGGRRKLRSLPLGKTLDSNRHVAMCTAVAYAAVTYLRWRLWLIKRWFHSMVYFKTAWSASNCGDNHDAVNWRSSNISILRRSS